MSKATATQNAGTDGLAWARLRREGWFPLAPEDSYVAPAIKILILFVAGYIQTPNRGWFPQDYVMGLHHITIYIGIALSGVVDFLARRGILAPRVTHLAFAGAALNG